MRCPTCGEGLEPGEVRCRACGTPTRLEPALARPSGVRRCARCQYQGEGVPYFRRGAHVGLLVGVSMLTYGLGGLVYWLARRRHLVCPRCGLGWEHASHALAVVPSGSERPGFEDESDERLPSGGTKRRVLGAIMVVVAAVSIALGVAEAEAVAIAVGAVLGVTGSLTFYWGWIGLEQRRKAIMHRMQRRVLRLASSRGGTLTVTEVAAELDLGLAAAEKVLMAMDDGFRVRSEISDEGLLYYEFPEILHRKQLGPGG